MTPAEEHEDVAGANPTGGEKPISAEIPGTTLKKDTGLDYSEASGLSRQILVDEGRLVYSRGSRPGANMWLVALDESRFVMEGASVEVTFGTGDMTVEVQGEPSIRFERVDPKSAYGIRPFAGRYCSPGVDISVAMSVGEEGLILHHPRNREERPEFIPVGTGKFLNMDVGEIQFRFDVGSAVPSGFDLDTGRVKGPRFERTAPDK